MYSADYTDLQILINEPSRVGPYTTNAGDATIEGFELEINYLAQNGVLIDLAVGYTDAGYDSLSPDLFSGLSVSDPWCLYQSGTHIFRSLKLSIPSSVR